MHDFYHYYEHARGPFRNLSELSDDEAAALLRDLRRDPRLMAARRSDDYLRRRRELETIARGIFVAKGGSPRTAVPHYLVVGACPWLESWFVDPAFVSFPASRFDPRTVSFSYGDLFPTFSPRVRDGREYRSQVYTIEEIADLIEKYGLPQEWNVDGSQGPERYVEVHLWDAVPPVAQST